MKKEILIAAVVLLAAASSGYAQEGELHGSIGLEFGSKYVWRGIDVYDDHAAIHSSVDLDLYGTGLGFNVLGHRAISGFETTERWDYTIYYRNAMCQEERYATNYMVGWRYYNYPELNMGTLDLQEVHVVLSWPKMCTLGIVPSYCVVKLWPSASGSSVGSKSPFGGTASGLAHIAMLDYPWTVPGILPETPEQVLNLHAETAYVDGVDPRGVNVDHDWLYALFGVTTNFDIYENLILTPGVYYQRTMDKSLIFPGPPSQDDSDETWANISLTYNF